MRAVLLRSLAVIGVGGIVLAGVLYVATTFDGRPPSVLEVRLTAPVADDERVALINTSIEVAFSEPVEPESAEEARADRAGGRGGGELERQHDAHHARRPAGAGDRLRRHDRGRASATSPATG